MVLPRFLLALAAGSWCLALGASQGAAQASLTFADAYQKAIIYASAPRAAKSARDTAAAQRELTAYADDPSFAIETGAERRYRDDGTGKAPGDGGRLASEWSLGASATVPLYDFGRHAARQHQADRAFEIARLGEDEAALALKYLVARAFLAVMAARERVAVVDEQVRVTKAKADAQTKNYRLGLRPESDFVQADVDLGRAEIARAKAADDLERAALRLGALIGSEGAVTPARLDARPSALVQIVNQWQAPAKTLTERREALQSEALDAEMAGVRADRRPVVDAVFLAERSGDAAPFGTQASAKLRLSWDVPVTGEARLREELVAVKSRALADDSERTARARRDAARLGQAALDASVRLAAALERQQSLSARQLRLVQNRYEAGRASALEVTTAEATLLAVKLDLINATQDAANAALDLAEARGVASVEDLFP